MDKHNVRLSSAEIGGLWTTYIQGSMTICLIKYFLHHLQDEEIKAILKQSDRIYSGQMKQIKEVFSQEKIPIPDAFGDEDLNLSAPPLFYDPFALTFVYAMSRMNMINFSFITSNITREDVRSFFSNCLSDALIQYNEATQLMLEKGMYDRPPMVVYPTENEYIEKKSYLTKVIGGKRPLNVVEITDMFFNIERNYFAIVLCMGFQQVVQDKEILEFIKEGRKISEMQITFINDLFKEENLMGTTSISMEVTGSTVSPFSDKLILTLFHALNAIDITLIGHAQSLSMRTDLIAFYTKTIGEIFLYAAKGFNLLVERGWMQEPPSNLDRNKLRNTHK
ncbi:DUF3231 family protein [Fredinandcohnia sp. QZ13]|uniref:DUF3231 family protein n=1 Tax=Fredinandcohnia sp. QZ13 TaxID=3073144 RepID=UPI0028535201|nr:DUF3231 family protein [Fredinandcohnia sp. QZ13]MDR4889497.1 DUF3231 family protein [Fredinandcohnia sp. QZ13]